MLHWTTSAVLATALALTACGGRTAPNVPALQPKVTAAPRAPSRQQLAELWADPGQAPRDLFWGVGGKRYAPPAGAVYKFEARDDTGFSASYDVASPDGMEWSAKIGPEAQTEVVVSRILWGLGYHQPPVYYLPSWKLDRKGEDVKIESEARFRPKLPRLKRLEEYWSWKQNPFLGTTQLKGLLVMLVMLNSTDLKDDNNSTYQLDQPWDGARRWFVVRDIGAALGETGKLDPRRNWLEGFERQGFITAITGARVEFDYDGRHQELLETITPADVQWAARRMRRLTNKQWQDAFRAANYAEADAERFIRRVKQKIEDGVALRAAAAPRER